MHIVLSIQQAPEIQGLLRKKFPCSFDIETGMVSFEWGQGGGGAGGSWQPLELQTATVCPQGGASCRMREGPNDSPTSLLTRLS